MGASAVQSDSNLMVNPPSGRKFNVLRVPDIAVNMSTANHSNFLDTLNPKLSPK